MPVLPWYRNQSIVLDSKSIDWFLYEGNAGIEWVNKSNSDDKHENKIRTMTQRICKAGPIFGAIFENVFTRS